MHVGCDNKWPVNLKKKGPVYETMNWICMQFRIKLPCTLMAIKHQITSETKYLMMHDLLSLCNIV